MVMPLEVEVKRWIQTHLAHTRSYICPVQKYGAFSYMFFTPNSLVCIAAAFCSGALPRPCPLLNLKTVKETWTFELEWADDQICSSSHWNKGQLTESIRSLLELLGQWRIQAPSCLPLPSRGCKSAMECQGKVQWTPLLWFLHSQWYTFELKREYRMLFCALTFMNIQIFFFCRLLQAHTFCQSTFHVCSLPHYSILPYWWTQLGATVLHIEITDLGQNFLYAVVDEETHCRRTSAIKCTLYVQILFNTGDHTADLDISHFYIIKKKSPYFFFFSGTRKK